MVSETPEALPYCCGAVEGVGLGQCGGWWCGVWRGGLCWRAGYGDGISLSGRGRGCSWWCVSAGARGGGGWYGSPCSVSVAGSWGVNGGGRCEGGIAGGGQGGGGCCAGWESGRPAGSCWRCVCLSCASRGPWLAAVSRWEVGARASAGAVVRWQWAAAGWRVSQAGVAVEGAANVGEVLLVGSGAVSARARPPAGL